MDLSKLKNKIKETEAKSQDLNKPSENTNYGDSFFKVSFLPEGEHKVRVIPDINSELVYIQHIHKIAGGKKRIKCDRHDKSQPMSACPICSAISEAEKAGATFDHTFKRSANSKMLVYLCATNNESEYWKPGNFYLVVSNSYLFHSVSAQIASILNIAQENNDDSVLEIFNPAAAGQYKFVIQHTPGNQGQTIFFASPFEKQMEPIIVPQDKLIDLAVEYIDNTQRKPEDEKAAIDAIKMRAAQAMVNAGNQAPSVPNNEQTPPPVYNAPQPEASNPGSVPPSPSSYNPNAGAVPPPPSEGSVPPPPSSGYNPTAGAVPPPPSASQNGDLPPPPPLP